MEIQELNKIGYFDADGLEYAIGDIVFNECANDYWVVQECTKEEQEGYGLDNKYCLALLNSKEYYCIEIDAPVGFKIVFRKNEPEYNDALANLAKELKYYESRYENEKN